MFSLCLVEERMRGVEGVGLETGSIYYVRKGICNIFLSKKMFVVISTKKVGKITKFEMPLFVDNLPITHPKSRGSKFSTFLGHAENSPIKNISTQGKKVSTVQVCSKITSLTTKMHTRQ